MGGGRVKQNRNVRGRAKKQLGLPTQKIEENMIILPKVKDRERQEDM